MTDGRRGFQPVHWAARSLRSLGGHPPDSADVEWLTGLLSDTEVGLFRRMSPADQRHAIGVARATQAELEAWDVGRIRESMRDGSAIADGDILVAAALHDVGKTVSGLGTYGRVVATLSGLLAGDDMAEHWQQTQGFTRRVGLYLRYPQLGAELLQLAGSAPLVVAWAAEHHQAPDEWTVPRAVGDLLSRCDR